MRLHEGLCVGGPRDGQSMARATRLVPVTVDGDIPVNTCSSTLAIGLYAWTEQRIPQVGGNGHWQWEEPQ